MSIRSESLPMRGRLSYQLEDLLRRNGMSAQLAVEDGRYKLLVQGHDSPLLSYDISEQQFRALGDGGTNYANKKAYNVFNGIVGKDFELPSSFVAARNVNGRVIMYVDDMTDSVRNAYDTTMKRRKLQMKYNEVHGITPTSTQRTLKEKLADENEKYKGVSGSDVEKMPKDELRLLIKDIEKDMKEAASRLDFERAAELRNKLYALKGMDK